MMRLM